MKNVIILAITSLAVLAASAATAQIKVKKDGSYEVKAPDGSTVTVDKKGNIVSGMPQTEDEAGGGSDSASLTLGGNTVKGPRTKGEPAACVASNDIAVDSQEIVGADTAVSMIGSCDADVFNSHIDAKKTGVDVVGSGDLNVEESSIKGGEIAINVAGSGDVVLVNAEISGPIALNLVGSGNVRARGSKIYGKIVIKGAGKFIDEGENTLVEQPNPNIGAAAPAAEPKGKKKSKK